MECTFEIVDCTDEDRYYTLGFANSLREAVGMIEACEVPPPISHGDMDWDEYCSVEIRFHKIGWGGHLRGHGESVWKRSWKKVWNGDDEQNWEIDL